MVRPVEVSSREPQRWEPMLKHAGAIFLGVYDFQKRSSLIEVSEAGAQTLGRIASVLAHGEGLQAHARAAEMRLKK